MNNYGERKQKILDGIKRIRIEKTEAATQIETIRGELIKKTEELGDFDSLKQAVKNLPDTAYKVLPNAMKNVVGKYRG